MIDRLAYIYTPTKTSDLEGGYTYTLSNPARIFLSVVFYENKINAYVRHNSASINQEDILSIEGQYYKVKNKATSGFSSMLVTLEKVSRPVGI